MVPFMAVKEMLPFMYIKDGRMVPTRPIKLIILAVVFILLLEGRPFLHHSTQADVESCGYKPAG